MVIEKLKAFLKDNSADIGTLMAVFYAVIIVVAIAVAFTLASVIGSSVESAVVIPANSQWNGTTNAAIITGAEIWTTQGAMLSAVIIIAVAAMALASLFAIFGTGGGTNGRNGKGGGM